MEYLFLFSSSAINETSEWWEDKERLKKVIAIDEDMDSGKDKGILWEQAKKQLLNR